MIASSLQLTASAQRALEAAQAHAARHGAEQVEPEHLLLGILSGKRTLTHDTLAALKIDRAQMEQQIAAQLPVEAVSSGMPQPGAAVKQVISDASKEAYHLGHKQLDALHLLMGLLYEQGSLAYTTLTGAGVSLYELRAQVLQQPIRFRAKTNVRLRDVLRPSPVFLIPVGGMIGSGLALWFGVGTQFGVFLTLMFVISGWITSLCLHEFGHALAAFLGGDTSVAKAGYLTLNPLKYTHPVFSLLMPVVFLLMGGLGLPGGAVYVDRGALRSAKWNTIVSAAGPLGTVAFSLLIVWPFFFDWYNWVTDQNYLFWPALAYLVFVQISALVFNLLPIPPLDGFGMIENLLPENVRFQAYRLSNLLFFLLLLAMWNDTPISYAFWDAVFHVADWVRLPLDLVFEVLDQLPF